jgi:hypothetical protein
MSQHKPDPEQTANAFLNRHLPDLMKAHQEFVDRHSMTGTPITFVLELRDDKAWFIYNRLVALRVSLGQYNQNQADLATDPAERRNVWVDVLDQQTADALLDKIGLADDYRKAVPAPPTGEDFPVVVVVPDWVLISVVGPQKRISRLEEAVFGTGPIAPNPAITVEPTPAEDIYNEAINDFCVRYQRSREAFRSMPDALAKFPATVEFVLLADLRHDRQRALIPAITELAAEIGGGIVTFGPSLGRVGDSPIAVFLLEPAAAMDLYQDLTGEQPPHPVVLPGDVRVTVVDSDMAVIQYMIEVDQLGSN